MPIAAEAPGHYLRFFAFPANVDKLEDGAVKSPAQLSAYIAEKANKVGEIRFLTANQIVSVMVSGARLLFWCCRRFLPKRISLQFFCGPLAT